MNEKTRAKIFKGHGNLYGVEKEGGVIYEADFPRRIAQRLADLEEENPSLDWEHAREILEKEGFKI